MCYDDSARPPHPPGSDGTAHGADLVLAAADGNRFAAYIAHPDNSQGAQVLIYPDIRGLHGFYKALAIRFAEVGITALAFDYFGRTAGLTARDDSFEFRSHVQQMQLPTVFSDVNASLAQLHTGAGANQPTFTVGFCMGGSLSFLSGTEPNFGFAGVVGFYAGLSRSMGGGRSSVLEEAKNQKYPLLGLFGGADQGIPVEQVHAFDEGVDQSGVEHEIIIYPNAPHSFFDRKATEFAAESADAWQRILGFIATHSNKG